MENCFSKEKLYHLKVHAKKDGCFFKHCKPCRVTQLHALSLSECNERQRAKVKDVGGN